MTKFKLLVVLVAVSAVGCSVTGRVQVNPPVTNGQRLTSAGVKGVGPVCATLEFKHEF